MYNLTSFLVILGVSLVLTLADDVYAACGYKACPDLKANMINVHLVPHSHDSVGWLKTVDQYYYGSNSKIQHAGVQYILESVVTELSKDKNRRFIYAECAFFFKWYADQTSVVRKQVQKLVKDGRLVFVGGAWTTNDEATVHYQSVIDQFSLGLKALSDTFGPCGRPTIGWQINPFGHSREQTSLFAQMGFDGEFFARVDWVEKAARFRNLSAEMIWKASSDLGESSELFTGVLWNHYSSPPGFCFDELCTDQPFIDGQSYDNNVKERVDAFLDYINDMSKVYRSSHLMVPMGDDFNYENAAINFKNMDKLIKHVNERQRFGSKVRLFYSTPDCYLQALHANGMLTWPLKDQDFLPYSSDGHSYWTGYYTSRPGLKRAARLGNHFLQVAKQLTALANFTGRIALDNLNELRQAMGIMQHHHAITGAQRQNVANDYNRLLTDALHAAHLNARQALQILTGLKQGEFSSCLQLNVSVCEATQRFASQSVLLTLFNPLAHNSRQYVRVPVKMDKYTVTDEQGRVVPSQLVPLPQEVLALPARRNDSQHELVFRASVLKLANYFVNRSTAPRFSHVGDVTSSPSPRASNETVVAFPNVKLTFNAQGRLVQVNMNDVVEQIRQEFFYYRAAAGPNLNSNTRSSGAFIFRPNGSEVLINDKATLTVVDGPLVKEVHQRFNAWLSQVVRIYEGVDRVEFEWLVGPIPIHDHVGKEIITRFASTIQSNNVFWTDSNGREMLRRVRNVREGFQANLSETVSANYYPVTTRIAIEDARKRLALLNDRAQGGTSIRSGTIELMLHRRLLSDDGLGLGEALNETAFGQGLVARGKVYLMLGSTPKKPSVAERSAQQKIHLPLWAFFSNLPKGGFKPILPRLPDFVSLPQSIELLSLEPYSEKERLLRLEHYMDRNETTSVKFNLRRLFESLSGEEIRETTLDGSLPLVEMRRFKFAPDGAKPSTKRQFHTCKHVPLNAKKKDASNKFDVVFEPMQIRTFIIKWK